MRLSIGISALAISAGLLAGVQPAHAATALACHVSPGIPYKSGARVEGVVTWIGDCGRMTLKVQRKDWYGWNTINSDTWTKDSDKKVGLPAKCGSGTHDWRVYVETAKAGNFTNISRRITC
ncbi:hypothetical protein AB0K18_09930 [Nonomuraea sp. NPDC049421]|uniref:hypothetical protein n=1 Tax=Nonomuraea sp. NPDC049421 TaxID=3155275 RepID=UPI00342FA3E9